MAGINRSLSPSTDGAPSTKLEKVLGLPPGLVGILFGLTEPSPKLCWLPGVTGAGVEAATARPGAGGRLPVKRAGDWAGLEKEEGNWGRRLLLDTENGVTLIGSGVVKKEGLGVPVTASPRPLSVVDGKLKGDAVVVWTRLTKKGDNPSSWA